MTNSQIGISILIMSLVTIAIRFLPFVLFADKKTPKWMLRLEKTLPFAVIGMLVIYCLKDTSFSAAIGFVPTIIAVLAVVLSYVWKKNTLLSIVVGTVLYMVLVQFVFV